MIGKLKLGIFTAAVVATVAPAAGSAATYKEFRSPTGNIGCIVGGGVARCDIRNYTYKPPTHHCVEGFYGNSFDVGRTGKGLIGCASDSALDPNARPLAYGTSVTIQGFTCSSAITGMTCKSNASGHGFFLSIQGYRLF